MLGVCLPAGDGLAVGPAAVVGTPILVRLRTEVVAGRRPKPRRPAMPKPAKSVVRD